MTGYLEVNMKPARGGVARLPAPQPMKKREDSRPVTFVFFATQEKQEPNCHEMKNPKRKSKNFLWSRAGYRSNFPHNGRRKTFFIFRRSFYLNQELFCVLGSFKVQGVVLVQGEH